MNGVEVAQRFAHGSHVTQSASDRYRSVVTFQLGDHRVRLMQTRAWDWKRSVFQGEAQASMSIGAQQYMMASMMNGWDPTVPKADDAAVLAYLRRWRHEAQYRYWFETDAGGRDRLQRESSLPKDGKVQECLDEIRQCWPEAWTGDDGDPGHFFPLAEDQVSARSRPTELMDEDIIVVTDRLNQLVFANFEKLAQLLLGPTTTNRLADCLDLWSFFTPLPAPEPARRVIDRHTIMKMHPELDMSKATIDTLAQAKIATAHYGSCAAQGDPNGIQKTRDSEFLGVPNSGNCVDMLPGLYQAAFGKSSRLIRFLLEPLDPLAYKVASAIFSKLPESRRISVRDYDSPDFLSRFSLGVNKESCNDGKGVKGGIAGLVTLGQYQGGELCIPNLGLRVLCAPGTTTLIGNEFNYYTHDCWGPRFVVTGSNEEACSQYAFRGLLRGSNIIW
ncbi:hypothetical protein PG991_009620 [Apiospora marii]|uniref:Uncharacterized protein n=1 Tax=Apiospora marii TaxID=335849 RepID=A0ABR1RHC3_9PEZI